MCVCSLFLVECVVVVDCLREAMAGKALNDGSMGVSQKVKDELEKVEIYLGAAVKKGTAMLNNFEDNYKKGSVKFKETYKTLQSCIKAGMKDKAIAFGYKIKYVRVHVMIRTQ